MSKKIKIGMIGAGAIAQAYAQSFTNCEHAELAAVVDVRKEAAEAVAESHGCFAVTDYKKLLKTTDVDAVLVCTPPITHPEICIHFLEKGIHVLCEKPLAVDSESALSMVAAAEESGALFTGDHVMGWSTSVIVPPDGDMRDYMESLDKIYEREDRIYYPAHGAPIEKPKQLVRSMIGHRKQRERQIVRLLGEDNRSVEALVKEMYKGLDPRLTKAAALSVTAHLLDLEKRGLAAVDGADVWSAA